MVVLNLEVSFFLPRIREKLLKLDLEPFGDVGEAAAADAGVLGADLSGHQDPLVDGLESDVDVERFPLVDGDQALSPLGGCWHVERVLAHLTGTVHEIANGKDERTRHMLSDHDHPS